MLKNLACGIALTVLSLPAFAQGANQNTTGAVQTARNVVQERCMETAQRRVANRGEISAEGSLVRVQRLHARSGP